MRLDAGDGKGKGVFATQVRAQPGPAQRAAPLIRRGCVPQPLLKQLPAPNQTGLPLPTQVFEAGEVVLQDPPLAAIQHTANREGEAGRWTVLCSGAALHSGSLPLLPRA